MTTRARGVASSILGSAFLASPALACVYSGVPCLPTGCLVSAINNQVVPTGIPRALDGRGGSPGGSLTFASFNVTMLSQVTLAQMGGGAGSSLHGWVDPLTNREYAIMGRSTGTSFVDITNPSLPLVVANLPRVSGSTATSWREPKVYGNNVYIGVDGTTVGMQVMDLTKLRTATNNQTLTANSVYGGVTRIHTMAINPQSGYLYLSGTNLNSGAPHILDVRNGTPVVAGNVPGGTGWDGYSHEAQVVMYNGPDTQHQGKEIMVSSNGKQGATADTISIVNVTNKAAPVRLSSQGYAGAGYIHQGWFTEDQRYFFQNDELDEPGVGRTRTHLWDLQDLDNPVYRGFFQHQGSSVDHNLYVKGDYVYETNYTTGLRILKIGDLASADPNDWLEEVAFFDTYEANDGSTYNGAWNNYPYFPSGNVAISDINGGLFVVRPELPGSGPGYDPQRAPGFDIPAVPEPGAAMALGCLAVGLVSRHRHRTGGR